MDYFHNNDDGYISWLETQPNSFVINAGTSCPGRSIIHTARCPFLYPLKPRRTHTGAYPKACSDDRAELERWASAHGHSLANCYFCMDRNPRS